MAKKGSLSINSENIFPIIKNMKNETMSTATIVEPTGVPNAMEIKSPKTAHTTDNTAEHIVTDLKVLNTRIADRAGKMISAEINSEPTRFIASTMITAMMTARIKLYSFAFTPVARAKLSSKVIQNIL